jgi:cytochrome c oxidase subunit 1
MAIEGAQIDAPTWGEALHGWVTTVDHKRIGLLYILFALLFLAIAGVEALVIRIQLMYPHNDFVSPQVFNRMFTMHGTTMIFFFAMPILFGFGNYLVPLMIGARDMAFPRLNAFSFWLSALSGFLLYFSFLGGSGLYGAGNAPDVGWWAYAPLTARAFSPGSSTDYWTIAVLVSGFGSIGTAVNLIATILCMRCPGMTLGRMPLLAWLYLTMSGLALIGITPLSAAQLMLLVDRSAAISSTRRPADPPRSGCTSSGSSVTLRSTSSSFRRLPSCRRSFRSSRANRSSVIRSWWRRRCASRSSA